MSTAYQYLAHYPVEINLQYGQTLVLYLKGGWAKANMKRHTPKEKTSVKGNAVVLINPWFYNSGAKYPKVPEDLVTNSPLIGSANPKSQILISNFLSNSIFSNLMSLCTKPNLWIYWIAAVNYKIMYLIEVIENGFYPLAKISKRSIFSKSSVIIYLSLWFPSIKCTTLWWSI